MKHLLTALFLLLLSATGARAQADRNAALAGLHALAAKAVGKTFAEEGSDFMYKVAIRSQKIGPDAVLTRTEYTAKEVAGKTMESTYDHIDWSSLTLSEFDFMDEKEAIYNVTLTFRKKLHYRSVATGEDADEGSTESLSFFLRKSDEAAARRLLDIIKK
ncbi:MAG: hypothetical protein EOO11_13745 [Chitinophagaceae bacterium]|nr:MAG: hypothetical protein EOO11_13745 [Chitinophagaceae bacterium]